MCIACGLVSETGGKGVFHLTGGKYLFPQAGKTWTGARGGGGPDAAARPLDWTRGEFNQKKKFVC